MTLAQVQATIALITFLITTWAGLTIAVALLLPKNAGKAESFIAESPFKSFLTGLAMLLPFAITVAMVRLPGGGAKLLGFLGIVALGAALAIGAAGMSLLLGRRISDMAGDRPGFSSLVRGGIVYSLAIGFPLIGWFGFLPAAIVISLGSGTRALLRASQAARPPISPLNSDYETSGSHGAI